MNYVVPLSSVSITDLEVSSVNDALRRTDVSGTAPGVADLERILCQLTGSRHAIALNSGTSALEVALEALQLPPGSGVIVPALTFAAPASAILSAGHKPLICDVEDSTWTLDVAAVEQLVNQGAAAILAVDVMGNPCDYETLISFGLPVIQDSAEAIGARYQGEAAGSSGLIGVLSFHANKPVTGGEGGALLTSDDVLAERARLVVNHGMLPGYVHSIAGRNLRMSNLAACLVSAQCSRLSELLGRRAAIARRYMRGLAGLSVDWQRSTPGAEGVVWLTALRTVLRDGLVADLQANGIDARAIWPSLEVQPFLSSFARPCPTAALLSQEVLWLPTFFDMEDSTVDMIIDTIRAYFARSNA